MDIKNPRRIIRLLIAIVVALVGYTVANLISGHLLSTIQWLSKWVPLVKRISPIILVTAIIYFYIQDDSIIEKRGNSREIVKILLIATGGALISYLIIPLIVEVLLVALSWLYPWITSAGSVISVIMTAGLLYLYSKQQSVLSRQTDIQREQNRLMNQQIRWDEADKKPWLEVGEWGATEDNRLYFDMANIGGSPIKNLNTMICISPKEWDEDDPMWVPRLRSTPRSPLVNSDGRSMIGPGISENTRYYTDVTLSFVHPSADMDGMHKNGTFKEFLEVVDDTYISMHRIWFTLIYDDINGSDQIIHLCTIDFNIKDVKEIKDIFEMGTIVNGTIDEYQRSPKPPEALQ
ncbi:hypothetical protein [Halosimplex amylolyticum]|uniref:hypothetical protein n=1 Tax=Halosimplex amylolyticum TaxID=3396616 RepID=UPI003F57F6A0